MSKDWQSISKSKFIMHLFVIGILTAPILLTGCSSMNKLQYTTLAGRPNLDGLTNEEKAFYKENKQFLSREDWAEWIYESSKEKRDKLLAKMKPIIEEKKEDAKEEEKAEAKRQDPGTSSNPREKILIEKTNAKKNAAYVAALAFFSKTFQSSKNAIRSTDQNEGQIIAKGNIECSNLKYQKAKFKTESIGQYSFTMDFQAKDNRIRLQFEQLSQLDSLTVDHPTDYGELNELSKKCLEPLAESLVEYINGAAKKKQEW